MDLILWRHAEAEHGAPDAARKLTPKGVRQARAMAGWLRRNLPSPVKVIASPAVRAHDTARAYAEIVETRDDVAVGTTAARLLEAAQWPDGGSTVLIVGHQPALGTAAALALTGKSAAWPMKKGAIWWLRSTSDGPPLVVAVLTPRLARGGYGTR